MNVDWRYEAGELSPDGRVFWLMQYLPRVILLILVLKARNYADFKSICQCLQLNVVFCP